MILQPRTTDGAEQIILEAYVRVRAVQNAREVCISNGHVVQHTHELMCQPRIMHRLCAQRSGNYVPGWMNSWEDMHQ